MKALKGTVFVAAVAALVGVAAPAAMAAEAAHPPAPAKNWTAPAAKIYAQILSDEIMAHHPELLSVTFHGAPPGAGKLYTMFAGSYPDRIGNPDDPDDVDVSVKGITIIDPRWRRSDAVKKFVVLMPLRDVAAQNIGLIVFAFKTDGDGGKGERDYFAAAMDLRDGLEPRIPSYGSLFEAAK